MENAVGKIGHRLCVAWQYRHNTIQFRETSGFRSTALGHGKRRDPRTKQVVQGVKQDDRVVTTSDGKRQAHPVMESAQTPAEGYPVLGFNVGHSLASA